MTCPFCDPAPSEILLANDLAYARFDLYPVSPGHLLLIPFRHVASFFEATGDEQAALQALVHDARRLQDERYAPDGYNIGVNIGAAAGQSVMHLHLHVIPCQCRFTFPHFRRRKNTQMRRDKIPQLCRNKNP
ncbi:diadenosine tetraphosphate (Ap4A) HIT family hydrolase, partial [Methanocalculus alkaliphilus]|uniref:HIT family protein n=1 Tax=Methanocalculus alkaliphilus TaxID=768730 RepID=UPI00344BEB47|nr:diadenosine tetraphosphate (Ap4A) HIT family hydrolase [Methanocalculus alkaliphilus]